MNVTVVTDTQSRTDDLTEQDYRDIYTELREKLSLRQFIAQLDSTASPSWWSQYEAGGKELNWEKKNELRRAVGLRLLAPTVALACSDSPDATVYQVGTGISNRIVKIAQNAPEALNLHINGSVSISACNASVTPVTLAGNGIVRRGRNCVGIGGLQRETRHALDTKRQALGMTWDGFLGRLLELSEVQS